MAVLVLADLHLDIWGEAGRDPLAGLDRRVLSRLDALIVAGDLVNKPKVRWRPALDRLASLVPPERVWVLPGNHDFYQHVLDGEDRLREIAHAAGVHYAQMRALHVGPVRFLCCTLWTDFALHGAPEEAMRAAGAAMNDYHLIRVAGGGYRRARPRDTLALHRQHRTWLEDALAAPHDGPTVVVTHHAPHPDCTGASRAPTDPAYASDLRDLIATHRPALWLHGHTHRQGVLTQGDSPIACVSLGYPDEVPPGAEAARLMAGLVSVPSGQADGQPRLPA
jgi:Icc-related predicted phosphoesterase